MKLLDKDSPNILYYDNHIVVAIKEKGMLTQPSPTEDFSLEALVKVYFQKKENKPSIFLHAIHRLDKDVSGIVLFAKSSKALSRLNDQMREKQFEKIYVAEVSGVFKQKKGIYIDYLTQGHHKAHVVKPCDPNGKKCELEYKVLKEKKDTSIVEVKLITGRYHQIRCQMAYHDHPIVGDSKYGGKKNILKKGIALHQQKISFMHPTLKKLMTFEAPPQSE